MLGSKSGEGTHCVKDHPAHLQQRELVLRPELHKKESKIPVQTPQEQTRTMPGASSRMPCFDMSCI